MGRTRVIALVLVLVLAGCSAPVARNAPPTTQTDSGSADGRLDFSGCAVSAAQPTSSDPTADVQGWEDGYWYNETIAIDDSDGLNQTERERLVDRAMARVECVRGVEFERDVPVNVITREDYRERVTGGSGGGGGGNGTPSAARTYRQVKYEALLLLGGSEDATQKENQNKAASVQGYYDIREDQIVIVSDAARPSIDEITLSQELFHAYQFRRLVPRRLPHDYTEDTITAWRAVIEGDANLVDQVYQYRCERDWQCLRPGQDESGGSNSSDGGTDGPGIHMGLYLLQYFPYSEGVEYVRDVYAKEGWDGVDALYEDLPASSEQVIHQNRDEPGTVRLDDRSSDRWDPVVNQGDPYVTVGEYGLATMFGYTLYDDRNGSLVARETFLNVENGSVNRTNPLNYGIEPTSGWDADRLYVYRNDAGETGYVWRIAWDDPDAARQFVEGYGRLLEYRGATSLGDGAYRIDGGSFAGAFQVERDGRTVTVAKAPTREGIEGLYPAAAGVNATTEAGG